MRRQTLSNIAFYITTIALILMIVLCVGNTVRSEDSAEAQRIENRAQEQQMLTQMRQYLNENGYRNSGVTLTYVTDAEGHYEYTFTIHHKLIDEMGEEEREHFGTELAQHCKASDGNCISYEFLLTDR